MDTCAPDAPWKSTAPANRSSRAPAAVLATGEPAEHGEVNGRWKTPADSYQPSTTRRLTPGLDAADMWFFPRPVEYSEVCSYDLSACALEEINRFPLCANAVNAVFLAN